MRKLSNLKKVEVMTIIPMFVMGIWLPLLATMWGHSSGHFNDVEKRKLAEVPKLELTLSAINQFPKQFSQYFDDNFGLRGRLIRLHSIIKGRFFRISPTPNAIMGKQGWLFLGGDNIVADYRHTHPLTKEELIRWRDVLVSKRDWLAAHGIRYLFVVAPDKHSIYPEFMPGYLKQVRPDSCLDQLIAYLKVNSDIAILDLRPALLKTKANMRVFHKTDTHWNERGAYIAYEQIMSRLSQDFPSLNPKALDGFTLVEEEVEGQDVANMMGLREEIKELNFRLPPRTPRCARSVEFKPNPSYLWPSYSPDHAPYARECDGAKYKAVFFQDSFGTALAPFISEHFKRIVYIWDYPNYSVMNAAVLQESPNVVIEERVERHVKPMMPDFDFPSDLVGMWESNNNKVEIRHLSSGSVYLINEHGSNTIGLIKDSRLIVNEWNVTGELSSDRNKIVWVNGTVWTR